MRLNPMALALAFGVAKVVVSVFSVVVIGAIPWLTSSGRVGDSTFIAVHFTDYRFILFQLVLGFLGGAIAGALSAVIYNKVIARNAQA